MTINTAKVSTLSAQSSERPYKLSIGRLTIEGKTYAVSIESSNELMQSAPANTIGKIESLVNSYITTLKENKNPEMEKFKLHELDVNQLSYFNENKQLDTLKSDAIPEKNIVAEDNAKTISEIYSKIIESVYKKSDILSNWEELSESKENTEETRIETNSSELHKESTPNQPLTHESKEENLISSSPSDVTFLERMGGLVKKSPFSTINFFSPNASSNDNHQDLMTTGSYKTIQEESDTGDDSVSQQPASPKETSEEKSTSLLYSAFSSGATALGRAVHGIKDLFTRSSSYSPDSSEKKADEDYSTEETLPKEEKPVQIRKDAVKEKGNNLPNITIKFQRVNDNSGEENTTTGTKQAIIDLSNTATILNNLASNDNNLKKKEEIKEKNTSSGFAEGIIKQSTDL